MRRLFKYLSALFIPLPLTKYRIFGDSMLPVLYPRDVVLINRIAYLLGRPKIGDIVALRDPRDKKILIKRITKIENDQYTVLGDNQKHSTDSRVFGMIEKKDIIGKVVYKIPNI